MMTPTTTGTPNAQLTVASDYLQTFNAQVIHELERERMRIRSQDLYASSSSSRPTMTSTDTFIALDNGSELDATSVVSSRISLDVASKDLSLEHSLSSPSPSASQSPSALCHEVLQLPIQPQGGKSANNNSSADESEPQSASVSEVYPELIRLIVSAVLLATARYSIPAALGALTILGLGAWRQERLNLSGGSESAVASNWREKCWIFFFGNTKEKVWVQGSIPISESEITSELKCPISLSLFVDPVCFKPTGRVYERRHIFQHLSMSSNGSGACDPMSRLPASHKDYVPAPLFRTRAHEIAKVLGYVLVDSL